MSYCNESDLFEIMILAIFQILLFEVEPVYIHHTTKIDYDLSEVNNM